MIESGGAEDGVAAKIKSHHNVGGLPADMRMELVEPLRLLFKDEVRRVGEELGLPERMVWRQPFPGPGLAIRIIGDVTAERLEILRAADACLQEEIRRAGLYRELWQSFAVLPAIRSVGVQGDERTYALPDRDPRGHLRGRDDRRLGAAALRRAGDDLEPDRQRDPGRQPGRARHLLEAAVDDRVGVAIGRWSSLLDYRAEFPILERTTYLINHSLGAMPRRVEERLAEYADMWRERGVRAWGEGWWELPITVGDQIGRIVGAPAGSTVMHQNVAIAEAVVLSCFRPRRLSGTASSTSAPTSRASATCTSRGPTSTWSSARTTGRSWTRSTSARCSFRSATSSSSPARSRTSPRSSPARTRSAPT